MILFRLNSLGTCCEGQRDGSCETNHQNGRQYKHPGPPWTDPTSLGYIPGELPKEQEIKWPRYFVVHVV